MRLLHRAHQEAVPFENLSIHLSEPISLEERALVDKIVRRRRGGFTLLEILLSLALAGLLLVALDTLIFSMEQEARCGRGG